MTPLYQELHRWAATPFAWGEADCILVVADWIARVHGIDLAADLRGSYDDAASCQRATGFLREPLRLTSERMAGAGFEVTPAPVRGDVGVLLILLDGVPRPCGGLCLGDCWGVKSPRGVTTLSPKVLRAWSVGYAD
ncbi:MAG: hypothetical protein VYD87_16475 [Pseudomonadota bacterium]|nr:hypothetical protein [Pseudomonadota bacterium]MEE3101931.1 hypothetical protein [Pseudomonadota bacterium]